MTTLSDQYLSIARGLHQDQKPHADMRKAGPLELQMIGQNDRRLPPDGVNPDIKRFELANPVQRRPVSIAPPGVSRIVGFLDGSQRTVAAWRIGLVPVYATVVAAAILLRDERGHVSLAPGTLRLDHRWLVPRHTENLDVNDLIDRIESTGGTIHDPLVAKCDQSGELDEELYQSYVSSYPELVNAAFDAAGQVRGELELQLLDQWPDVAPNDESWLVVDGRLQLAVPRALGLVKAEERAQLIGAEAVQLYDLPPGHRTTAFQPGNRTRTPNASPQVLSDLRSEIASGDLSPIMWYVRMHDATGLDARHGLIRVEILADDENANDSDHLDELSSWLLAERVPRATADERWAQLLYPIHLLEGMLKRHIAAHTRVWPNAG